MLVKLEVVGEETVRWMNDYVNCELKLGGKVEVGVIHNPPMLGVSEKLVFEGDVKLCDSCRIEGRELIFGADAYISHHAEIGGGSCYERESSFRCGRNFHLGSYSMINTARPVTIGDNVGIGRMSLIATHGVYLDVTEGFPEQWAPVHIGSNVWLPQATVLPGVTIGDCTVVAAGSLVNKDIEGFGLWAGIPAKQIKNIKYPNPMLPEEKDAYVKQFHGDSNLMRRHGIRKL